MSGTHHELVTDGGIDRLRSIIPGVPENNGLSRHQRKFVRDFEVKCPHCGVTFEQVPRWLEHSREVFDP